MTFLRLSNVNPKDTADKHLYVNSDHIVKVISAWNACGIPYTQVYLVRGETLGVHEDIEEIYKAVNGDGV